MKSALTLLGEAWQGFIANPKQLLILALPLVLMDVLIAFVTDASGSLVIPGNFSQGMEFVLIGLILVGVFLASFLSTSLITYAYAEPERAVSIDHLRRVISRLLPLLWVSLLSTVVMFIGFILLIIPGIYAMLALMFTTYVILFEDARGLAALKMSHSYMKKARTALGLKLLFVLIIMIAATAAIGFLGSFFPYQVAEFIFSEILTIIVNIVLFGYLYLLYREFKNYSVGIPTVTTSVPTSPTPVA
jgi:hypothetical protein